MKKYKSVPASRTQVTFFALAVTHEIRHDVLSLILSLVFAVLWLIED